MKIKHTSIEIGKVYTNFKVIGKTFKNRLYWFCVCIHCGNNKIIRDDQLKFGYSSKCCIKRNPLLATTHGMSKTSEYSAYSSMKARCYNVNIKHYFNYGGRGIKVCERWLESFENFFEDMGFSHGLTLDRIDNNGNYCKENCRWTTMKVQQNNKRNRWR